MTKMRTRTQGVIHYYKGRGDGRRHVDGDSGKFSLAATGMDFGEPASGPYEGLTQRHRGPGASSYWASFTHSQSVLRISTLVLIRKVRFSEIGSAEAIDRICNKAGSPGPPAGFSTPSRVEIGFWTHGSLKAAVWQWISRLRSEQQAGQDQQVEAGDREAHILLKMGQAFPGAASKTEDSLEPRDPTFDPGPKASQLPVDPTGTRHLLNLQPAFLSEGDVSDALALGPPQVALEAKHPSKLTCRGQRP